MAALTAHGNWTPVSPSVLTVDIVSSAWSSPTVCVAVGYRYEYGAILRSSDRGFSWSTINSSSTMPLTTDVAQVTISSTTYFLVVGYKSGAGYIYKSRNNGVSFQLTNTLANTELYGVTIGSNQNAYAAGRYSSLASGTALHSVVYTSSSSSGYETWTAISPSNSILKLNDISTFDGTNVIAVGSSGKVYLSSDSGASWVLAASKTVSALYGISHGSGSVAMAVGSSGTVLTTTDSGATWSLVYSSLFAHNSVNASFQYNSVSMLSSTVAYIGGSSGVILTTINAGSSWSYDDSYVGSIGTVIYSISMYSDTCGLAGTERSKGMFLKTVSPTGQPTRQPSSQPSLQPTSHPTTLLPPTIKPSSQPSSAPSEFVSPRLEWFRETYAVSAISKAVAWMSPTRVLTVGEKGGTGLIYLSTSAGASWSLVKSVDDCSFDSVDTIATSSVTYAVAITNIGDVYVSSSAGSSWTALSTSLPTLPSDISIGYSGAAYICGAGSSIYSSQPPYTSWTSLSTSSLASVRLYSISTRDGVNIVAVGASGSIFTSSNNGTTWTARSSGVVGNLFSVSFGSSSVAMASGDAGTLLRTNDRGVSWKILSNALFSSSYAVSNVAMASAYAAYATTSQGYILVTHNSGSTWSVSSSAAYSTGDVYYSLDMHSSDVGMAGDSGGNVYILDASPTSQPTSSPSNPSGQPSSQPTGRTAKPTRPSSQPTRQPTAQPSMQPTGQPTQKPSMPSGQPSSHPSSKYTPQPTTKPSNPTPGPSGQPSRQPTAQPSTQPTQQPSTPTGQPSERPSAQPSSQPFSKPSAQPSTQPSSQPTSPTGQPSGSPTSSPSTKIMTAVVFNVSQRINGISFSELSASANAKSAVKVAVARSVSTIARATSVVIISVTNDSTISSSRRLASSTDSTISSSRRLASLKSHYYSAKLYLSSLLPPLHALLERELATSNAAKKVYVFYSVTVIAEVLGFTDPAAAFSSATTSLQSAVTSGHFLVYLKNASAAMGGDDLCRNATSSAVDYMASTFSTYYAHNTRSPTFAPTHYYSLYGYGLSASSIALIAVFTTVGTILIVLLIVYVCKRRMCPNTKLCGICGGNDKAPRGKCCGTLRCLCGCVWNVFYYAFCCFLCYRRPATKPSEGATQNVLYSQSGQANLSTNAAGSAKTGVAPGRKSAPTKKTVINILGYKFVINGGPVLASDRAKKDLEKGGLEIRKRQEKLYQSDDDVGLPRTGESGKTASLRSKRETASDAAVAKPPDKAGGAKSAGLFSSLPAMPAVGLPGLSFGAFTRKKETEGASAGGDPFRRGGGAAGKAAPKEQEKSAWALPAITFTRLSDPAGKGGVREESKRGPDGEAFSLAPKRSSLNASKPEPAKALPPPTPVPAPAPAPAPVPAPAAAPETKKGGGGRDLVALRGQ